MLRRIFWLLPIVLMAGYAFWGLEWTDYQKGYNEAMRHAARSERETGELWKWSGPLREAADRLPLNLPPQPGGQQQSPQWHEGYRQALQDYLRDRER